VVADEQKHHFNVLFALLGLVRPELSDACHHLSYGMVNLPDGRMKSREGTVVDADNLFDEMAGLAAKELRERSAAGRAHAVQGDAGERGAEIQRRAEVIAQAAIKFYILSVNAESSMTFDPDKSIDFMGRTGPYCLNAYARTRQVLAKAGDVTALDEDTLALLISEREQNVVRALMALPREIERGVGDFDPAKIASATYDIARAFNQLYTDKEGHPIVSCTEVSLRDARLHLCDAVSVGLKLGLYLIGIDVLEQM
jgi:arginyl-tRNA synthetase